MTKNWQGLRRTPFFLLLLLALAIVLSRLPLYFNANAYLDGDEALYGLMTFHVLQGKGIPIFPYGQSYGVSVFETLVMSAFGWLLGIRPAVMQASMLSLWTLAVMFFALALWRFTRNSATLSAVALLVLSPAWGHISMASWGFYQTAFLFSNVSLWLIAGLIEDRRPSHGSLIALGLSLGMVFVTQPIYTIGLAPFLLLLVLRRRRLSDGIFVLLSLELVIVPFLFASSSAPGYYRPAWFQGLEILTSLRLILIRLWVALSGAYILDHLLPMGPATFITATFWLLGALTLGIRFIVPNRWQRGFAPGHASLLAVVLILSFSLAVSPRLYGYRYMLPSVGFLCLALGIELGMALTGPSRSGRIFASAVLAAFLIGGSASMVELGRLNFSGSPVQSDEPEGPALQALIRSLLREQVEHVYTTGAMFQWKLTFASAERVKARWVHPTDRYPEYPLDIDRALYSGQHVAIVHEAPDTHQMAESLALAGFGHLAPRQVAGRYTVLLNPPVELVGTMFRLNPPGALLIGH